MLASHAQQSSATLEHLLSSAMHSVDVAQGEGGGGGGGGSAGGEGGAGGTAGGGDSW